MMAPRIEPIMSKFSHCQTAVAQGDVIRVFMGRDFPIRGNDGVQEYRLHGHGWIVQMVNVEEGCIHALTDMGKVLELRGRYDDDMSIAVIGYMPPRIGYKEPPFVEQPKPRRRRRGVLSE